MATPSAAAAIVASSDDAIIGLTLEGIVTSWNAGAERIYGYSASEMVGYRIHRVVPRELHEAETSRLARAARGEGVRTSDAPRLRRDGSSIVASSSFFPVRDDRFRIAAVGVIERDVTQQRALEAQLLQAKRMEAVGRLAGGVAQEFNNVNTTILGLVGFVAPHVTEPDARADLEDIAEQARRASRLAQHLLSFSDRETSPLGPVCVNGSLRSMEPLLQRLVGERVWLTLDLAVEDRVVRAAASELELVIFELVMRTADSLGGHGAITITTRHAIVDDTSFPTPAGVPSGEYMEVVVREAGRQGNPAAEAAAGVFDEFGMAMVYSVISRFGGHVVATSLRLDEEDGSEVSVFIPLAVPGTAVNVVEAVVAARAFTDADETVLLVEDEEAVRDVLARGLRARGYHVLVAQNGEDALNVAEAHAAPIDLVISDVVMPQMDGRALFDRLRGWYPGIRFLFVSGYTRGAIEADQLRSPVTEFLAKPFTMEALCGTVRSLLSRP